MDIQNEINDIRSEKDFKGISFSGYKLTEVKMNFLRSLKENKIEEACYWSAEMVCSAHYIELWDAIVSYYSRQIHLANPKMANYLEQRIQLFVEIIKDYSGRDLLARNNRKIRHLVCEVVCMVCSSKKSNTCADIKISELQKDISAIRDMYQAPNLKFLENVFTEDDPRELFIPINEFCYQVSSEGGNTYAACFWIEWTIDHVKGACKRGSKLICKRRLFLDISVAGSLQMDPVWLIWEAITLETASRKKPLLKKVIQSLLYLFSLKYTSGTYAKRKYLLFFAVSLLTLPMNIEKEPLLSPQTKELLDVVKGKIHNVYRQVKSNEQSPATDYLFNGLDKRSSLEKSLQKLEMLNGMSSREGGGGGGGGGGGHEEAEAAEAEEEAELVELTREDVSGGLVPGMRSGVVSFPRHSMEKP
jgi:hypothetical protein